MVWLATDLYKIFDHYQQFTGLLGCSFVDIDWCKCYGLWLCLVVSSLIKRAYQHTRMEEPKVVYNLFDLQKV